MKAMAEDDDSAPPAVDRKGKPVIADGWKIIERVPLSEDVTEHMEREVLPFAPDAQWDVTKAKHATEIPFTRIFYVPEDPLPLADIDAAVQRLTGELATLLTESEEVRVGTVKISKSR